MAGPMPRHLRLGAPILMGLLLFAAGCREEKITVQKIPKGTESIGSATLNPSPDSPSPAQSEPVAEELRIWVTPKGWREVPATNAMRLATLMIEEEGNEPVEVALSSFAGNVGGDLANVNRWRGQVGLAPIEESQLEASIERFSSPGFPGYYLRMDGTEKTMLAAGILGESANRTWFVRVTTDSKTATRVEAAVKAFAKSFGNRTESAS